MIENTQDKPALIFAFPENTPKETLDSFNSNQLQITQAMYPNHLFVISVAEGEKSEEFLNKIGPGEYAVNNIHNLLNLENVFGQINTCLYNNEFNGAVDLLTYSSNEDGSKEVVITQCFTMKPELNEHNFFFKIFVKTNPFTAFIDQTSGKLVVDQETLNTITVAEVLEPELYVTDKHGNLYHPESFFKMRSHGVRHPFFNLNSENLKRGVLQTLKVDQNAWKTILRHGIPQILNKTVIEPMSK